MNKLSNIPDELKSLKKVPDALYYIGDTSLLQRKKVSIVGTRKPINYTKQYTSLLSSRLSQAGFTIVSGAAMGVDALAHRSALPNTIAVMANSLEYKYPSVNKELIENIYKNSLAVSEYKENYRATKYSFVIRNRIVVALGDFLIITQADLKSGTMRSAEIAIELGKKIYVLPHRTRESEGTQYLLKEGLAEPIYDIEEFVSEFHVDSLNQTDDFLTFCQKVPTLEECLKNFGNIVYEYELEGKITINNLRVYPS